MSRNIRTIALAGLPLAIATLCGVTQAADTPLPAHGRPDVFTHMLQKMDTNGDGRISLDEYVAAATTRFKSIDVHDKGGIDAADIASSSGAIARIDHRAERLVRRIDTAGNGYITPDEFVAAAQQRFARLDRNGDGKLMPDELTRGRGRAAAASGKLAQFARKRFDKVDADHDGVVTADEYVAAARALYAQFDAKHDGRVTAAEIESSPRTQERAVRVAEHLVKHMDTNGDGLVSQDEFLAAARTRFARIDRNGDGFIDADEAAGRRWAGKGHRPNG